MWAIPLMCCATWRMGDEDRRTGDHAFHSLYTGRAFQRVRAAQAGRCGGGNRALERGARFGRLEGRSGAGCRMHHCAEAVAAIAVDRPATGGTRPGGGNTRRRGQRGDGTRQCGGRRPGASPRCRHGFLYRLDRHGKPDCGRRRGIPETVQPGARRKSPLLIMGRCGSGSCNPRGGLGDLRQSRAELLCRLPSLCA